MTAGVGLACAIALLAIHNMAIERVAWWLYVPANLATAACLVGLAAVAGPDAASLGLSASAARTGGLAVGLIGGLAVALVIGVLAQVPAARRLFDDKRLAGVGQAGTAYRAGVRIPLGTVVLEEVAFRGVLVALFDLVAPLVWAVALSCALFGMWHIVPTASALDTNGLATARPRRGLALAGAAVATAAAGAFLCWLRLATASLLAPALVHVAATATATVAAYALRPPET